MTRLNLVILVKKKTKTLNRYTFSCKEKLTIRNVAGNCRRISSVAHNGDIYGFCANVDSRNL